MQRSPSSSATTASSVPPASVGRMLLSPFVRVIRILRLPVPTTIPTSQFSTLLGHIFAAIKRLDTSFDPRKTLAKLSKHEFTLANSANFVILFALAVFSLYIVDSVFIKLLIPIAYIIGLLLPISSQFVFPATYILSWLLVFFTSRFIPSSWRPSIHVVLLPTLESVLYGANISDLLTRYTHPALDILAWLPYGFVHFVIPFVVAAILWVFCPRGSIQFWAKAFGLMMLWGVLIQLLLPTSAPWYEIIHGLTPANYGMSGSPGGLMRIDRIFHSSGYTNAFGSAPLIFGAFPSLHSGNATMQALTLSHFFPRFKACYWAYAGVLYWATMYLTHHYLIDVVGGGCLAMGCFYYFMPSELRNINTGINWEGAKDARLHQGMQYEVVEDGGEYDIDEEIRKLEGNGNVATSSDAPYEEGSRKGRRTVSWGATEVLGGGEGSTGENGHSRM